MTGSSHQSGHTSPLHSGQQQHLCQDGSYNQRKKSKEIIHSGHFMVSDFEAEARDDDDEVSIPIPENDGESSVLATVAVQVGVNPAGDLAGVTTPGPSLSAVVRPKISDASSLDFSSYGSSFLKNQMIPTRPREKFTMPNFVDDFYNGPSVTIDQSLTKLFQCMTLAYSSKLTSPRWKNFKGLRLQWKDKIRLNNLIWRCWHMQFIERRNTAVCQFASPLEVDQHNKPEAVVLEGKYWKRRLATVTAEYKKWRIFYKNQIMGRTSNDLNDLAVSGELDHLDWFAPRSNCSFNSGTGSLALDDEFCMDFTDTLFSSLSSNQPFPFPNPREIAKGAGLADFIQPGLIQLQPNLDDFMDTLEPLQELLSGRLPPVEEEISVVDETANRTQTDSRGQQGHHHHSRQFQLTDAAIPDPPPQPETLINPMDSYMSAMDQSAEGTYLSSLQFNQLETTSTPSSRSVTYDFAPSSQVNPPSPYASKNIKIPSIF